MFFWIVGGIAGWWAWNEYQKQRQAQTEMFAAPEIPAIDYTGAQATRFRTGFEYPVSYPRTGMI